MPADELVAYSRWITPKVVPIRFDTRFYLALAPAHSPPRPDGSETVDAGWFDPQEALEQPPRRRAAPGLPHDQAPRVARRTSQAPPRRWRPRGAAR